MKLFQRTDSDVIGKAMREHVRLMREVAERDALISKLREPAKLAREAIAMFCHPDLHDSAQQWLKSKGIQ